MERILLETSGAGTLAAIPELRGMFARTAQHSVKVKSMVDKMTLCVSEAITNLVLHGGSESTRIGLRFAQLSNGWSLDIMDDGQAWDPTRQTAQPVAESFRIQCRRWCLLAPRRFC